LSQITTYPMGSRFENMDMQSPHSTHCTHRYLADPVCQTEGHLNFIFLCREKQEFKVKFTTNRYCSKEEYHFYLSYFKKLKLHSRKQLLSAY